MAYGGTSFVTIAPAPTIAPSPIFTPSFINAPQPIQTSFPIVQGITLSYFYSFTQPHCLS